MFERNINLSGTKLHVIHRIQAILVDKDNAIHLTLHNIFKVNSTNIWVCPKQTFWSIQFLWYAYLPCSRHHVRHLINDPPLLVLNIMCHARAFHDLMMPQTGL